MFKTLEPTLDHVQWMQYLSGIEDILYVREQIVKELDIFDDFRKRWKAVCYHYVRRKRHVTRHRNGESYTSSQVYYERVNSHAAGAVFVFAYCGYKDISKNLILDPKGPIVKIRFTKGFAFTNVEAAAEFEDQRSRFFTEHERYDDYMEMREGLDLSNIPNFKEHMVAYADPDHLPWYSRECAFWISSFLLLSWPLRMILEYNTVYVHYRIVKLFGTNYNDLTPTIDNPIVAEARSIQVNSPPRLILPHVTTIDSGDWERTIVNNNTIVPSYSEAILIKEPEDLCESVETKDSQNIFENKQCGQIKSMLRRCSLDGLPKRKNDDKTKNRRSWGGWGNLNNPKSVRSDSVCQGDNSHRVLYYPSQLPDSIPIDPFQRPPSYFDALTFPVMTRLRRSLTERGEIWKKGQDENRRSGGDFVTVPIAFDNGDRV